MNTVGILVVGNEILDGVTLDTNTQWMITQLKPLNYHVTETFTVRDNTAEIAKALNRMREDSIQLIITTGGLGPTYDDLTLKGIAKGLGVEMEINTEALEIVERQYMNFYLRGVVESPDITDARKKMAILPRGANPLDNKAGGAPGVILDTGENIIVCLPGVPSELKWIFSNPFYEILSSNAEGYYHERIVYLSVRDESMLSPLIDKANELEEDVYIKSMVKSMEDDTSGFNIRLWISCHGDSLPIIKTKVDTVSEYLLSLAKERLGTH